MAKEITLTRGEVALVDDEDYTWLSKHNWFYVSGGYAARQVYIKDKEGSRQKILYMHRAILKSPPNKHTDHINGNGLDNRRSNIRICTVAQNAKNKAAYKGRRWKGIVQEDTGRWRAVITSEGEGFRSKTYTTEEDAARAYDRLAMKHHGAFCRLNFKDSRTFDWGAFDERTKAERKAHRAKTKKKRQASSMMTDHSRRRKSLYRGVHDAGNANGWIVRIYHKGKSHYGGFFKCEKAAARRYNELTTNLRGDAAPLNEVE